MNRIQEVRKAAGMTQTELANAAGVSQPYIVDLERGARGAKPETWERIANALGVTVADLTAEYHNAGQNETAAEQA